MKYGNNIEAFRIFLGYYRNFLNNEKSILSKKWHVSIISQSPTLKINYTSSNIYNLKYLYP